MKKCKLYYLSLKDKKFIEVPVRSTESKKRATELQPTLERIYERNIYVKEIK